MVCEQKRWWLRRWYMLWISECICWRIQNASAFISTLEDIYEFQLISLFCDITQNWRDRQQNSPMKITKSCFNLICLEVIDNPKSRWDEVRYHSLFCYSNMMYLIAKFHISFSKDVSCQFVGDVVSMSKEIFNSNIHWQPTLHILFLFLLEFHFKNDELELHILREHQLISLRLWGAFLKYILVVMYGKSKVTY